jgi:hypothetical protein
MRAQIIDWGRHEPPPALTQRRWCHCLTARPVAITPQGALTGGADRPQTLPLLKVDQQRHSGVGSSEIDPKRTVASRSPWPRQGARRALECQGAIGLCTLSRGPRSRSGPVCAGRSGSKMKSGGSKARHRPGGRQLYRAGTWRPIMCLNGNVDSVRRIQPPTLTAAAGDLWRGRRFLLTGCGPPRASLVGG